MKNESKKNWTTCLRLNTGDGSPRVFLLNSHFLGSVPELVIHFNYFPVYLTGGTSNGNPLRVFVFYIVYSAKNANNSLENSSAYWKIDPWPAFG